MATAAITTDTTTQVSIPASPTPKEAVPRKNKTKREAGDENLDRAD
jgi:hypothetical protein